MLPFPHVHPAQLPKSQRNGLRAFRMVAVLHKITATESAEQDHLQSIGRLLIPSFEGVSLTRLLQSRQDLRTASLYNGPTNVRALANTWGRLLPTESLRP